MRGGIIHTGNGNGVLAYTTAEKQALEKYWVQTSSVRPTSMERWVKQEHNFPIRLKHINPTTLPRRWQTLMR
jgi:hypothetical protein